MRRILAVEYPELALEWIENDISPMDVTVGSHKKIRWKGKCGHEWTAIIKNRVKDGSLYQRREKVQNEG